jgi:plastocyanin
MKLRCTRLMAATLAVMAFTMASAAACGDDDDGDPGGVATSVQDDRDQRTPGAGGGAPTPADGDASRGSTVELSADNAESFDTDELTAPAGEVTIIFDNRDNGVLHNVAVFQSQDDLADPIGATDLAPGPATQELTVELDAGEYYYHCDSHPNMNGALTVEGA